MNKFHIPRSASASVPPRPFRPDISFVTGVGVENYRRGPVSDPDISIPVTISLFFRYPEVFLMVFHSWRRLQLPLLLVEPWAQQKCTVRGCQLCNATISRVFGVRQ